MQRDMYPLCPYQDAWKPDKPLDTRAGGAMPGPTLLVQVAARESEVGESATTSAKTNKRFRTLPTTCLTRGRDQRYVKVAERCLLLLPAMPDEPRLERSLVQASQALCHPRTQKRRGRGRGPVTRAEPTRFFGGRPTRV